MLGLLSVFFKILYLSIWHPFITGPVILTIFSYFLYSWCSDIWGPYKLWRDRPSQGLVQFSSVTQSCPTLYDLMGCSTPGLPVHDQLTELTQTHVHQVGDDIQPSHPMSSPSPPASVFPSTRVFPNESVLHIKCPKYWSFSLSISPSNEYSGLIFFRMDRLDLLEVQGTFKSLLQHHSSKPSILLRSAFSTVQLSHPYMTAGKTIALTRQTFVWQSNVFPFSMLSR